MRYLCEIPNDARASALRWLAAHVPDYTLIYRHRSLNAYAWGGLRNAPGGVWSADKVVFDDPGNAERYEDAVSAL